MAEQETENYRLVGDCKNCVNNTLEALKLKIKIISSSEPKPLPGTSKWFITVTTKAMKK